ncbi:HAD hydrolase family protein, partial [Bacteroides sp.]|uniref:HAD hydrolase family protein n=1 Tax=Bacteroides sp. TaxID=29523 RepID=UPI0023BC8410
FHRQLKVVPIEANPYAEALAGKAIYQMTPFINAEEEKEVLPDVPNCEMGRWHPAFVDMTATGNTKQKGIDQIIRHFGIHLEETMAFGDGGNDISMLQHAGIGVAMGNAKEDVKAAADYVTTSVDEDGIANALKRFGIIDN